MAVDTNQRVDRFRQAAEAEKLSPPQLIQQPPAARPSGNGVHKAYCKTSAGAGSTIVCYLDTDHTGEEVTVYCDICGGSDLNSAQPRLTDGFPIKVVRIDGKWECNFAFQATEDCICETI